ncbi:unnamed protein product [Cuscuta europaea]|uniref:Arabidopsis retrotransposon Orf1 C-terminal domain-containing protein n=1 Tax=Cuscuta europaea TaxID=41803 RepID=A0A9P0ZXZ8_CUSEU|nr:unnamed protein product [Cuscuta europaea]
MPPKRSRPSSSTASVPVPEVPGYEGLQFTTQAHRKRFIEETKRQVYPCRFLCIASLKALLLYDLMIELCNRLGLISLMNIAYNPNERVIYEFLGSCKFTDDANDEYKDKLTFRYLNDEKELTKYEFAEHFGLPILEKEARGRKIDTSVVHEMWKRMTGERIVRTSHMYISHVQHPVFRIMLKWFGYFVFGRPNNHQTRKTDVGILAMAALMESPKLDVASLMWKHLRKEWCDATGDLFIGGIILHICSKFGYTQRQPMPEWGLVCTQFLLNAHDLSSSHNFGDKFFYKWHINTTPQRFFILPTETELPTDIFDAQFGDGRHFCLPGAIPEHYIIPEEIPAQIEPPPYIPNPPQNEPQPDPHAPQFSLFEQQMLAGMNQIHLNQTATDGRINNLYEEVRQAREEQRLRLDRLEENQRRALGPIHVYFDNQGYFSSIPVQHQHPTWYDPSFWGNFGGASGSGGGYGGEGSGYGGYHDEANDTEH